MDGFVYNPGDEPEKPAPLARYLPPTLDGVATVFLAQRLAPGNWVLDPLGASPRLVTEMARSGYRVGCH